MKKEVKEEEFLEEYVGDHYKKIKKGYFSLPAFLFTHFYARYQRFYSLDFLYLIIFLGLFGWFVVTSDILAIAILVIVKLMIGIIYNSLYLSHAKEKVSRILEKKKDWSTRKILEYCRNMSHLKIGPLLLNIVLDIILVIAYLYYILIIT